MNDKTLGAYKRHEAPDYADGGVAAALIEEEDGVDAAASRLAAFARKFGVPPEWTTAPAVQAWHRSDLRTEHDGTPGQPRIWSPDYKTTETWSTPSLRNVHWSDLVDVTPLAPVRGCPDPDEHVRYDAELADAEKAERGMHHAQSERDELRSLYEGQIEVIGRLQRAAESRPLTPDAITDEARDRAYRAVAALSVCDWDDMSGVAKGRAMAVVEAVITEITRPEPPAHPKGAEEIEALVDAWKLHAEPRPTLPDFLAEHGVRVVAEEDPR